MTTDARRAAFIQALRGCASFLEQHPEIGMPVSTTMNVFVDEREEVAAVARMTTWEKVYTDNFFTLRKTFCEDLTFEINAPRTAVCRRVVKGTRVIPAKPEQIVEDVEWVCDEPLLAEEVA